MTNWSIFCRRYFQIHFVVWNWCKFKFSEKFVPNGPVNNDLAFISDDNCAPNGWRTITWTIDGLVSRRFYTSLGLNGVTHDYVIKWKHFPLYWPFVWGIHRLPVNSPHKGQWRGALVFTLICPLINVWVNNREAGDLRRHCAHYDVIVMRLNVFATLGVQVTI